jgi:hypothetical protein
MPGAILTTEHSNKSEIPEDKSSSVDSEVWWKNLNYPGKRDETGRPACEEPFSSYEGEKRIRDHYLQLSRRGRLIVKNPQHLARVEIVSRVIPDVRFVWAARNPWSILKSSWKAGQPHGRFRKKYIRQPYLRLGEILSIPESDIVARSAHGLGYMAYRLQDVPGPIFKYEDIVRDPPAEITKIFRLLGETNPPNSAVFSLPKERQSNHDDIKDVAQSSPMWPKIKENIDRYSRAFGYHLAQD